MSMNKGQNKNSLERVFFRLLLSRLYLPTLSLALIAIALVAWMGGRAIKKQQAQLSTSMGYLVDLLIEDMIVTVNDAAAEIELLGPEAMQAILETTQTAHHDFDTIYILNKRGIIQAIAPFEKRYLGLDMSRQPYFDQIANSDEIIISKPFNSLRTSQPTVYLAKKINDGTLVAEISLSGLQKAIEISQSKPGDSLVFVVNQSGTLLAHPQQELVSQQANMRYLEIVRAGLQENTSRFYFDNKQLWMGLTRRSNLTNWLIVIQIPLWDIYGPYIGTAILVSLFSLAIFITMLLFFLRNIRHEFSQPLLQLIHWSDILAGGDYKQIEQTSTILASFEEINQLIHSFQGMARSILTRDIDLRQSEQKFRSFVEQSADGIMLIDHNMNIIDLNETEAIILDIPAEEAIGQNVLSFFQRFVVDKKRGQAIINKTKRTIQNSSAIQFIEGTPSLNNEHSIRRPNGEERQILETRFPIKTEHGVLLGVIHRDITEQKKIEDDLLISQKMAELGTLAAGIAHEINSPLQVITGITDSLHSRLSKKEALTSSEIKNDLKIISRNAWRVAEIVRSLLIYARPSSENLESHNFNMIVSDALLLIEHQIKNWSNIVIKSNLANTLPAIYCDRNKITQVLINLIVNAKDAMPEGGTIHINTTYCEEKEQIELSINDSGPGIPEDILQRIFDPFFTTKPIGRGTGLGLSIVMSIVRFHGGSIKVDSSPQNGTTFLLSFPTLPPEPTTNKPETDPPIARFDA